MSKRTFNFDCPNRLNHNAITSIDLEIPNYLVTWCFHCYYPMKLYPKENTVEIYQYELNKTAFLIHSSNKNEKRILDYFRSLLKLWGVSTFIIENDARPVDWLQKSLDGITKADFVISFLTKRYQYTDEEGKIVGWKAPDKCYDEIAIAFALNKQIIALVEKEVDSGNVLNTRAWCFQFHRVNEQTLEPPSPIMIEFDFFDQLFRVIGLR